MNLGTEISVLSLTFFCPVVCVLYFFIFHLLGFLRILFSREEETVPGCGF